MSYYYKYNFVSPNPIYATVKEELKSYFDTGAIDDLMFPTYTNKCLNKLGRGSYKIEEELLYIEDFEARLPDNFIAAREAWMCVEIPLSSYQFDSSFYSQQGASCTTIQVSPALVYGEEYFAPVCTNPSCTECTPNFIQAVYKTTGEISRAYSRTYMLKPGNISAKNKCDVEYTGNWLRHLEHVNPYASSYDSFDIRDNKFVTNFRNGVVYLLFYIEDYDDEGNQLVPDNYRIREYIEAFIKYKMFETLYNQINDETFNQIEKKLMMYKQASDEAFILARTETMKHTPWETQRRITQTLNRHNRYHLPSGRRRNI